MKKFLQICLLCFSMCCALAGFAACGGAVKVSGVSFNENNVELYVGDEYILEYSVFPENAENVGVYFISSDENIITVQSGGKIYALSQGSATVTITTEDGGYSDICYITVSQNSDDSQGGAGQSEEDIKDNTDDQGYDHEDNNDNEDNNDDEENENPEVSGYKVTFIAGGETIAVCEFTEDDLYIDEPELPKKTGYTAEWESYELTLNNITVYAVYTPINYNITFIGYDGGIILKTTYTVESVSINEPQVPSREHYCGEWEEYVLSGGDIEVRAVYSPVEYSLKFIAGGEIISEQTYTIENKNITIPDCPSVEGYTAEWQTFTLTYSDIEVNAVYTPVDYTITFMAEGYTVDKMTFTVEMVSVDAPEVPSKAGYEGKWEDYSLICDDIIVNAVYKIINYSITYENTKGAANPNADSYNVKNVFALQDLSADGYIFEGWYIGDEKITSVNSSYGDLIITAKWSLINYMVIFTDENYEEILTIYYTVEDSDITLPDVPAKEGYTGSWSEYKLTYSDKTVYVHAVYTKDE